MDESSTVLCEIRDNTAHLRLNRPEAGNAVDAPMFAQLFRHLEDLHGRDDLRAVVLSATGPDFCLGRDRKPPATPPTALQMREAIRIIPRLNQLVATLPCPTIAAVQGRASGMGAGLTLQCDLTVAADSAAFEFPEIGHDLPPTIVLSYLPRHLTPKRCFELVVLGHPIDAATALAWGMVNRVVPAEQLLDSTLALAAEIATHGTVALRTLKQYLQQSRGLAEGPAYELGINVLANVGSSGQAGVFDKR